MPESGFAPLKTTLLRCNQIFQRTLLKTHIHTWLDFFPLLWEGFQSIQDHKSKLKNTPVGVVNCHQLNITNILTIVQHMKNCLLLGSAFRTLTILRETTPLSIIICHIFFPFKMSHMKVRTRSELVISIFSSKSSP